jgi:Tol biopolymer transport system component
VLGRGVGLLLCPLLVACASGLAAPTPTELPPPGPSDQGSTAMATTRPPSADAATVGGTIVLVRDNTIVVQQGGQLRTVFAASGGSVKDPVFSPDGRSVAFAHAPAPSETAAGTPAAAQPFVSDVMVVGADGSNPRVAVGHEAPGAVLEMPAWAPDGKSLYVTYYAPEFMSAASTADLVEVRRRDLATGATTTLLKGASNPGPSPDGAWLAYVGETRQGPSLRRVAVDGTGDAELVPTGRFLSIVAPRVSPDGATVAFGAEVEPAPAGTPRASGPPGLLRALIEPPAALAHGYPWEIWTVPSAGGPARQLTRLDEDTPRAAWSADGARLLVRGAGGVHLVDASTGGAQPVSAEGDHGGMDWHPTS